MAESYTVTLTFTVDSRGHADDLAEGLERVFQQESVVDAHGTPTITKTLQTTGVRHPIQPAVLVGGILRFKENLIVRYLLDHGSIDMNTIARLPFETDDRIQFAQLIGYSLSGAGELGYMDDATMDAAYAQAERCGLIKGETR